VLFRDLHGFIRQMAVLRRGYEFRNFRSQRFVAADLHVGMTL
jgi:hypothetical protein